MVTIRDLIYILVRVVPLSHILQYDRAVQQHNSVCLAMWIVEGPAIKI